MRLPRAGRWAIPVLAFLLVPGVYYGWLLWQIGRDLSDANEAAQRARRAMIAGDDAAIAPAVDDLAKHSTAAANLTGGPTWAVLEALPLVGDDAEAVARSARS